MAWTPPMTAVPNDEYAAAEFNTNVRDNLNHLFDEKADKLPTVSARIDLVGTQSIPTSTVTKASLNTVRYDLGGNWDAGNFWYVIPTNGVYMMTASASYASNSTGHRWCDIESSVGRLVTNNAVATSTTDRLVVSTMYQFTAGATVWLSVFHTAGSSLNLEGGSLTGNIVHLSVHLLERT